MRDKRLQEKDFSSIIETKKFKEIIESFELTPPKKQVLIFGTRFSKLNLKFIFINKYAIV